MTSPPEHTLEQVPLEQASFFAPQSVPELLAEQPQYLEFVLGSAQTFPWQQTCPSAQHCPPHSAWFGGQTVAHLPFLHNWLREVQLEPALLVLHPQLA